MEDEHEDFQNGKKNQWIEACGTLGIYSATASQELHVLRHKHGTTQTWDTWPRSRQGHGSIGHDSTKNQKKKPTRLNFQTLGIELLALRSSLELGDGVLSSSTDVNTGKHRRTRGTRGLATSPQAAGPSLGTDPAPVPGGTRTQPAGREAPEHPRALLSIGTGTEKSREGPGRHPGAAQRSSPGVETKKSTAKGHKFTRNFSPSRSVVEGTNCTFTPNTEQRLLPAPARHVGVGNDFDATPSSAARRLRSHSHVSHSISYPPRDSQARVRKFLIPQLLFSTVFSPQLVAQQSHRDLLGPVPRAGASPRTGTSLATNWDAKEQFINK